MLSQMTLELIPNVTSSPESEFGPTRFALRAGTMTVRCGLVVAHASLSARQAKRLGSMTSGTYGQHGSTSSSTQNREAYQSLVSRLRARTDLLGSTLFTLTWKERATPSGRLISALRASARRISDKDCGSWPTPQASDMTGGGQAKRALNPERSNDLNDFAMLTAWPTPQARDHFPAHSEAYVAAKKAEGHGMQNLNDHVMLAGWPTPRAEDSESCGAHRGNPDSLTSATALASWVTPSARDWKDSAGMATKATNPDGSERQRMDMLPRQAQLAAWPTPTTPSGGQTTPEGTTATGKRPDGSKATVTLQNISSLASWPTPMAGTPAQQGYNEAGNTDSGRKTAALCGAEIAGSGITPMANWSGPARLTVTGEILTGSIAGMESGGQLNPAHSRWLMALPPAWDDCAAMATQLMPKRRKRLSKHMTE